MIDTTMAENESDADAPGNTADIVLRRSETGRNLTQGMLESLGRAIVIGRYDTHPFPTEADLALTYGVSRSVTREAVKMLTAKGLVSARPRQGTIVRPARDWNLIDPDVLRWLLERKFSVDLLRHFNELRVAIEPEAAALAARYHDPADLVGIDAGLAAMRAADRGDDDVLDADIAFHVAILLASRNPFYAQLRSVVETALRTSILFTNRIEGRSANVDAHAAVADAIRDGNPVAAHAAMRRIIGDVLTLMPPGT